MCLYCAHIICQYLCICNKYWCYIFSFPGIKCKTMVLILKVIDASVFWKNPLALKTSLFPELRIGIWRSDFSFAFIAEIEIVVVVFSGLSLYEGLHMMGEMKFFCYFFGYRQVSFNMVITVTLLVKCISPVTWKKNYTTIVTFTVTWG